MGDPAIAALQTTINKYASNVGFTRLVVDGVWGPNTRTGMLAALRWVATNQSMDQGFRDAAAKYQVERKFDDASLRAVTLAQIALFLGNIAASLKLVDKGPMVASKTTTPVPSPVLVTPTPSMPSQAASISLLGLKMPAWVLYVGGGVLALAVIGLVATRKKPSGAVSGSEWWEEEGVDEDVKRIHREGRKRTEQLVREVSSSKRAAIEWLEKVGSWPSSDPDVRKITAAAERRARR